jgi:hypothetical protein
MLNLRKLAGCVSLLSGRLPQIHAIAPNRRPIAFATKVSKENP